jgi:hypothetical protein
MLINEARRKDLLSDKVSINFYVFSPHEKSDLKKGKMPTDYHAM